MDEKYIYIFLFIVIIAVIIYFIYKSFIEPAQKVEKTVQSVISAPAQAVSKSIEQVKAGIQSISQVSQAVAQAEKKVIEEAKPVVLSPLTGVGGVYTAVTTIPKVYQSIAEKVFGKKEEKEEQKEKPKEYWSIQEMRYKGLESQIVKHQEETLKQLAPTEQFRRIEHEMMTRPLPTGGGPPSFRRLAF
jgi:cell shape-determining protein MreC